MALKTVELRRVRGITFAAKGGSNHWVIMDGSPIWEEETQGPHQKNFF